MKGCWQKGQALSFGAPAAALPVREDSAGETGVDICSAIARTEVYVALVVHLYDVAKVLSI